MVGEGLPCFHTIHLLMPANMGYPCLPGGRWQGRYAGHWPSPGGHASDRAPSLGVHASFRAGCPCKPRAPLQAAPNAFLWA